MDRQHDGSIATERATSVTRKRRSTKRHKKAKTLQEPQMASPANHTEPVHNQKFIEFIILHRIGEILISLLDKTLAKSRKYPKEAEIVDEALKNFINRKLKEIYGFSEEKLLKEESPLTKEEARRIIKETLEKAKAKDTKIEKPPASYISNTYVNPPEPSNDGYNPHSFINNRSGMYDTDKGDFSGSQIRNLAESLLKG